MEKGQEKRAIQGLTIVFSEKDSGKEQIKKKKKRVPFNIPLLLPEFLK